MNRPSASGMGASVQRQATLEPAASATSNISAGALPQVPQQQGQQQQAKVPPPYPGPNPIRLVKIPQNVQRPPIDRHQTVSCASGHQPQNNDALRQRLRSLEVDNRRLMASQGQLVAETNRRAEMHLNEVRMLKEEVKSLQSSNKELRDLCCFLDDDRQKTRRLSREWQKFGKYTSEVMKQEVRAYQAKLRELEDRQHMLINENEDLKRLCLYLDEQRQSMLTSMGVRTQGEGAGPQGDNPTTENGSVGCDSSGCGSSTGSQRGSEDEADDLAKTDAQHCNRYDDKQESTLRMITQQMQTSVCADGASASRDFEGPSSARSASCHNDRLFEYIQSLESRIRQLELSNTHNADGFWRSSTNLASELEDRTVIERDDWSAPSSESDSARNVRAVRPPRRIDSEKQLDVSEKAPSGKKDLFESTCTMTSSGTTYCSSDTDESAEMAVFVMGSEMDAGASLLEVRTLGPIDEEKEEEVARGELRSPNTASLCDQHMPPAIGPVSASVSRLSLCSSELSAEVSVALPAHALSSPNVACSRGSSPGGATAPASAPPDFSTHNSSVDSPDSGGNVVRDSLAEAVKVLRVHEMAARKSMRGLSAHETALVQHMCQIAWDSLDRKSQSLVGTQSATAVLKTHMTAV